MVDGTTGQPAFLLIGGAHVDRIARAGVAFRPGASHPGRMVARVGGAALNAAMALRRFGAPVELLSARGGDAGAEQVVRELREHAIEDRGIVWLDRETASYTAILENSGELVAGVADMAIYDALTPRALRRRHIVQALRGAPVLLVDANLPEATLHHVGETAPGLMAAIAVSPEKVVRLHALLARLDILFLSAAEACALANIEAPPDVAVRALAERGLRRAVVTDGRREVVVLDRGAIWRQAPPAVERVSDVTGAGDTLAAVTLLELSRNRPLPAAVRLGVAAAVLRITAGLPEHAPERARQLADQLPDPIETSKDCAA